MDVGVVEARQHTAAPEVDPVGARQSGLVGPDPARDPVACDRQCARDRKRRLHRPDDAALEDHVRNRSGASFVSNSMNRIVILLLLVVMLAVASYWPTSD